MGVFDDPLRTEVERKARPGLLHLMRNHSPSHAEPRALLQVVDAYLRLNPKTRRCSRRGTGCWAWRGRESASDGAG